MEKKKVVAIEIGHWYSNDREWIPDWEVEGTRSRELILNLEVGRELKRQLERHNLETVLNGTWGDFSQDKPMVEFYLENNPNDEAPTTTMGAKRLDVFYGELTEKEDLVAGIAAHFNALHGDSKGFEVYTQTTSLTGGDKRPDSVELCEKITDEMRMIRGDDMMRSPPVRNPFDYDVGGIIQHINKFSVPFAYCEFGFFDNPDDRAGFDTFEKQRDFGTAAAKGIITYLYEQGIIEKGWQEEHPISVFHIFPTQEQYEKIPNNSLVVRFNPRIPHIHKGTSYDDRFYRIQNGNAYYKTERFFPNGKNGVYSFPKFPTPAEYDAIPPNSLVLVLHARQHIYGGLYRIENGNMYYKIGGKNQIRNRRIFAFPHPLFPTLLQYNALPGNSIILVPHSRPSVYPGLHVISNGNKYFKV